MSSTEPLITTYPSGLVILKVNTMDDSHKMCDVARPSSILHYTTSVYGERACIYIHSTTNNKHAYSQCYDLKDRDKRNEYEETLLTLRSVLCSSK